MSTQQSLTPATTYFNVMELLVADEVDRQLQAIPPRLARYLKRSEIETFALNRLPALYAASEQGVHHQQAKAQQQLGSQITQAVRQALAAVQGDPLRASQPIQIKAPHPQADAALELLQQWLKSPDLTWDKALVVLSKMQQRQAQASQSPGELAAANTPTAPRSSTVYSRKASELNSTALRPGVYGCRTTWVPKQRRSQPWQQNAPSSPG
jgi:hypothetical protein